MHADVQDNARRPQPLGVQHPHAVRRVLLESQVRHEPLGVEGPALAVPTDPAAVAPPGVELVAQEGLHADLQVVARHALMEYRGPLLPGREVLSPGRD